MIKAVLFDVIGTTVRETSPGIIIDCLADAFAAHGIPVDQQFLKQQRGREKKELIRDVLTNQGFPITQAGTVYKAFAESFRTKLAHFSENEGVADIFSYLRKRNVKVGVGTGLERDLFELLYISLNWKDYHLDYIGIGGEVGRGRPYPDMLLDMMSKLHVIPAEVLKIGDTVADIREGKNAGVHTAIILSGTQEKQDLLGESPDFVLHGLLELKTLDILN